MTQNSKLFSKNFIFISGMFLFLIIIIKFNLLPQYYHLTEIHKQNVSLANQYRQQQNQLQQNKILEQKFISLTQKNSTKLLALNHLLSTTEIYQAIALLAQLQHLTIQEIKPLKTEKNSGLTKLTMQISLKGPELKVFSFLQLLMHQSWFFDYENVLMQIKDQQLYLEIKLDIYFHEQSF